MVNDLLDPAVAVEDVGAGEHAFKMSAVQQDNLEFIRAGMVGAGRACPRGLCSVVHVCPVADAIVLIICIAHIIRFLITIRFYKYCCFFSPNRTHDAILLNVLIDVEN